MNSDSALSPYSENIYQCCKLIIAIDSLSFQSTREVLVSGKHAQVVGEGGAQANNAPWGSSALEPSCL